MSHYQIKILRRAIALILTTVLLILNAETVRLDAAHASRMVQPRLRRAQIITQSSPSLQPTTVSEIRPLGIALEEMNYPYPVSFVDLSNEGQPVRMAYMDFSASGAANGRTIVLLHGRNFSGFYWQSAIEALSSAGYRVIVPDQVGFISPSINCIAIPSLQANPTLENPLTTLCECGQELKDNQEDK